MHCPELTLKGRNYIHLQRRLRANVVHRLACEGLDWPVKSAYGRLYVDVQSHAGDALRRALTALEETAGIASLAPAVWLRPSRTRQHRDDLDWPLLEETAVALAHAELTPDASFAVRVNRADHRLSTTAPTIEARLGEAIRRHTDWDQVNLEAPDRTFFVDVYPDGMYLYSRKREGVGGLPVGGSGKVMSLLSGGIDSPVAAYMLAKRGCEVELFHMSASLMSTAQLDASVVGRLARRISCFTLRTRLWAAPYLHFDLALPQPVASVGAAARRVGARALVTGDSLAQVASQTLDNMICASEASEMAVLRPLVGLHKEEIMRIARRIDTFDTSIQPYKDCCALLARRPRTRTDARTLAELEREAFPEYEALLEQTLDDVVCLRYDCGSRVDDSG